MLYNNNQSATYRSGLLGASKMKQSYVVEWNPTHTADGWSRMEFTSITKALGFISLMAKRGCHCQIFKA
jgi:hypothetical protein